MFSTFSIFVYSYYRNIYNSNAFVFLVVPVKILLMPERHMITLAFTIGLTILDLKKHFSFELRVPSDIIQITLDGTQKILEIVLHRRNCGKLKLIWKKELIYCKGHNKSLSDLLTLFLLFV